MYIFKYIFAGQTNYRERALWLPEGAQMRVNTRGTEQLLSINFTQRRLNSGLRPLTFVSICEAFTGPMKSTLPNG